MIVAIARPNMTEPTNKNAFLLFFPENPAKINNNPIIRYARTTIQEPNRNANDINSENMG